MEEVHNNLDFSEDGLFNMIDEQLFYKNVTRFGKKADELIDELDAFLVGVQIDGKNGNDISEQAMDIASEASRHSYRLGFVAGIQLFRSIMHL